MSKENPYSLRAAHDMVRLPEKQTYFVGGAGFNHITQHVVKKSALDASVTTPEDIKSHLNDGFFGMKYPDGLLVGDDNSIGDDSQCYLTQSLRSVDYLEHDDVYFVTVVTWYGIRQNVSSYDFATDVESSKFIIRYHDDDVSVKPNDVKQKLFDFGGKMMPYPTHELKAQLFFDWMMHKFTCMIFPCTFDPFFEEDGLIHRDTSTNYGNPKYDLPSGVSILDFRDTIVMGRQYHDSDYLNAGATAMYVHGT